LIELLEYVRRNATRPGGCKPFANATALRGAVAGVGGGGAWDAVGRDIRRPLDELEETVSSESWPWSDELDTSWGIGGTDVSAGAAKKPFFVVVGVVADADREPSEKRPFALGAEATRRMNRVADAPTDLGLRGPWVLGGFDDGVDGVWG